MSRSTYDKLNTSNRQPRNKETADPLPANYHDTYFKWLGYKGALYLHFISLDIDSYSGCLDKMNALQDTCPISFMNIDVF